MPLYHERLEPEPESTDFFYFFLTKNAQAELLAAIYQFRSLEEVLHQRRLWLFFPAFWLILSCFHSSVLLRG